MLTCEIQSLQHPIVKHLVKLRKERPYRQEKKTAIVLGKKIISQIAPVSPLKTLIVKKGKLIPPLFQANELFFVTPSILAKISGQAHPDPFIAEVSLPQESPLQDKTWLIACDEISDPGNLGTLFRTALALGVEGLYLLKGCVDPFNDKVIASAKGATFLLPFQWGSWRDFKTLFKKRWAIYRGDLHGTALVEITFQKPSILILSNESRGPSKGAIELSLPITIPMTEKMDSLNVAIAGSIIIYAMQMSYGKN